MKNIYQFRGATECTLQVYVTTGSAVQCRAAGVNVHARVCSQDGRAYAVQCGPGVQCVDCQCFVAVQLLNNKPKPTPPRLSIIHF